MQSSALNEHRFKHAFDCLNTVCFVVKKMKMTNTFSGLPPPQKNDVPRRDLFDQLSYVPGPDITSINNMDDDILSSNLVGNLSLGTIEKRVDATISFLKTYC